MSDVILTHCDQIPQVIAAADLSNSVIGAATLRAFPDAAQKSVAYVSRTFTAVERNYDPIENEALF